MARYDYCCKQHGVFEVEKAMSEAGREETCPDCGEVANRVFQPVMDIWHTDGAHKTDYFSGVGRVGTKADQLRENYERTTGEKAPPPAPDVPRNSSNPY